MPKIKHNSLSDTVYDFLYRRIAGGKLKPGQKITELQVAASHGISRSPVREALKRLAEDRLVKLVPRSGCYVCELTHDEVAEIFDIRKRLECLALEYAFPRFNRKELEDLGTKFQRCLKLDESSLAKEELKLDSHLHAMICNASGGRNLQDMLGKLRARIEMFRAREAAASRARLALEHHIAILDAILAGDRKGAVRFLEKHIDASREYTLASLRS